MEAVGAGRIVLGLEVIRLLFCVGVAGDCAISVSQPATLEVDSAEGAVTLLCSFTTTGCPSEPPTILWFRLGAQRPERLCVSSQCTSKADEFTKTEDLAQSQALLTVNRVTPNDSAIYICGVASPSAWEPRAKQTGAGTMLVVRETKGVSSGSRSLLIALLSLLSIYVAGVLVALVVLSKPKSNTLRKPETEGPQKKSARHIFREIAQELYNKRHVGTSQQSEKDNTYENRRVRYNYERP
ncbi:PREDICTED: immunoglobulin superfamily member 6 isoform X2 [Hipposideros armiger]|uniref:immunoglobulin superfamily member 6 isoform X2 n=1 Tax=Hipposideros armiger TaxID=186990 RepID=UPI00093A0D52|nr:PREDICTED: immunoglobulin superfamily member 6 isoform X2 [Hipposideros armiger]